MHLVLQSKDTQEPNNVSGSGIVNINSTSPSTPITRVYVRHGLWREGDFYVANNGARFSIKTHQINIFELDEKQLEWYLEDRKDTFKNWLKETYTELLQVIELAKEAYLEHLEDNNLEIDEESYHFKAISMFRRALLTNEECPYNPMLKYRDYFLDDK
ncbi:hypothetical protein [Mycoplasmopsis glycophila]|uniref:Uncharacterized protein n=1 Tax=Mycoplasmopsis glycophila TaxID=171285 RepID=A0A449AUJ0_9BACT|nr:hypothetical protein [Mycoplasmopsis glycophila]VEU70140.1 Uncharacterised protein [Mycoplasmopsis glycophila]